MGSCCGLAVCLPTFGQLKRNSIHIDTGPLLYTCVYMGYSLLVHLLYQQVRRAPETPARAQRPASMGRLAAGGQLEGGAGGNGFADVMYTSIRGPEKKSNLRNFRDDRSEMRRCYLCRLPVPFPLKNGKWAVGQREGG